MKTAKPFTWLVRFTIAPMWVQDGFTLDDERANSMLGHELSGARGDEYSACVLQAPQPREVASMQGYTARHAGRARAVQLIEGANTHTGEVRRALLAARRLLDSVAFVTSEGDTAPVIARIDEALAAIDPRQGEAVEVEE